MTNAGFYLLGVVVGSLLTAHYFIERDNIKHRNAFLDNLHDRLLSVELKLNPPVAQAEGK